MDFDFSKLSDEQVLTALDEVVAERGEDYVYRVPFSDPAGVYVKNNQPSCLVGATFAKVGVPLEVMSEWDNRLHCSGVDDILTGKLSDPLVRALTVAQEFQDGGNSWGEARGNAREEYKYQVENQS